MVAMEKDHEPDPVRLWIDGDDMGTMCRCAAEKLRDYEIANGRDASSVWIQNVQSFSPTFLPRDYTFKVS